MKNKFLFFCLLLILSNLWLSSCKHTASRAHNLPPSPFTVRVALSANGNDAHLSWDRAKDPNGDPVVYSVFFKDTLVKNLTDTTFIISNIGYNITVPGSVIAKDNHGASTSTSFTITVGDNPYTEIPDENFEKSLIKLKIDDTLDRKLLISSALKVSDLILIAEWGKEIKDLTGIEAFKNLKYLNCYGQSLPSVNLSSNTDLTTLVIPQNRLKNLDLSKNENLQILDCGQNQLTSLDLSKNKLLQSLNCQYNFNIPVLDLTQNSSLTVVNCAGIHLNDLNTTKLPFLKKLICYVNNFTSLDLSKNKDLQELDCSATRLSTLDLSNNINLTSLNCSYTNLNNLDVSQNTLLQTLDCHYDKGLTYLNFGKIQSIVSIDCSMSFLSKLDVYSCKNLQTLNCSSNLLSSLNLTTNSFLQTLNCSFNKISSLDLATNTNLQDLDCSFNQLTTLDLRTNTLIKTLDSIGNNIQVICLANLALVKSNWTKNSSAVYQICM